MTKITKGMEFKSTKDAWTEKHFKILDVFPEVTENKRKKVPKMMVKVENFAIKKEDWCSERTYNRLRFFETTVDVLKEYIDQGYLEKYEGQTNKRRI